MRSAIKWDGVTTLMTADDFKWLKVAAVFWVFVVLAPYAHYSIDAEAVNYQIRFKHLPSAMMNDLI